MHTLEQLRSGQLAGCRRLNLACDLREFPAEIFSLADSLEVLNLSGNCLASLPDDLPRLHKLRIIFCSNNQFTELPTVLGRCARLQMIGFKSNQIRQLPATALPVNLRWLILTDNQLDALPVELGQCRRLQKLMLAGNQLRQLPSSLADCQNLELLRIAANQLTELPHWLLSMPRLAWLGFAGNPFCAQAEAAALATHPIASIDWQQLSLAQVLGEGASGVIQQACWSAPNSEPREVAVKLFKGAVTSDGLPQSEMTACIAAGRHPNLIGLHGKLNQHPSQTPGLVLELIDPSFSNLANPPSLESCTRDIYNADRAFSLESLLAIAQGIASASAHLHAQGINHGDLYGHNILNNAQGNCLLGDFGAASFYNRGHQSQASALQRLEVRAFACVLEELLERCPPTDNTQAIIDTLWALQKACDSADIATRPLFEAIGLQLQRLQ
ncbi:MAG: leucine-rich repeat-containing protein kinase family protein [Pseudomonas sp.]|uniref:leucine-rich repeat-containing protein kinase family protein n=1 Tax=Pseudomonas sp. TaxID=306 RepID=UPI002736EE0E|nr:leucine-rich repeat-containing protein kinase family protein [Pseudomonas sp.]MDP3846083.1 leucine-rich repeat-containing protein kinase family protein [Pseudomonas sp.]